MTTRTAVGIDGCPVGWVGVINETGTIHIRRLPTIRSFLDRYLQATFVVDVPIGLLQEVGPGGRDCDIEARRLLGKPRDSSVFSPPARRYLDARSFAEVKGLTRQGFNLLGNIRQVDQIMTADLQVRVREGHPEVSFRALAGHPMRHRKTLAAGRLERSQALGLIEGDPFGPIRSNPRRQLRQFGISGVGVDDLLDACVMLWTAIRVMKGTARRIGSSTRDARGLEMAIWA